MDGSKYLTLPRRLALLIVIPLFTMIIFRMIKNSEITLIDAHLTKKSPSSLSLANRPGSAVLPRNGNFLQLNSSLPMVMFCGASQSSTLLSNAIISGLNRSFPYNLVVPKCPPEFLNPSCNIHPQKIKNCFGSQQDRYTHVLWQPCSDANLTEVLDYLSSSHVEFPKVNFAHGGLLLEMHSQGFPVSRVCGTSFAPTYLPRGWTMVYSHVG